MTDLRHRADRSERGRARRKTAGIEAGSRSAGVTGSPGGEAERGGHPGDGVGGAPAAAQVASVTAPWRLASRAPSGPRTSGTCAQAGRVEPEQVAEQRLAGGRRGAGRRRGRPPPPPGRHRRRRPRGCRRRRRRGGAGRGRRPGRCARRGGGRRSSPRRARRAAAARTARPPRPAAPTPRVGQLARRSPGRSPRALRRAGRRPPRGPRGGSRSSGRRGPPPRAARSASA